MNRYRSIEWLSRIDRPGSRLAAEVALGVACCVVMIGVRAIVDLWTPHAGPFALIYPTIMVATLFGRLAGGLTAYILALLWAWYFVLPPSGTFELSNAGDAARLTVNAGASIAVLLLSNLFRRAVVHKQTVLVAEIERRATLLREVNHRTRNNFALVISLLQLQRREAASEAHRADLEKAIRRVHSFAGAYALLADDDEPDALIDVAAYLEVLAQQLLPALVPAGVTVNRAFEPYQMAREQAVAVGLTLNEAVTNAVKYAFGEGQSGALDIRFEVRDGDWCLTVEDSAAARSETAAMERPVTSSAGVGTGLMAAFASQARGNLERTFTPKGMKVALCGGA